MRKNAICKTISVSMAIVMMALLLGLFTTSEHAESLGIEYLERGHQIERHQAILEGRAGDPWQYRVLAPYLVNAVIESFEYLNVPHHIGVSFILFRFIQDTCILVLSCIYYRALGLSLSSALIGMAILAWGMSYSHYDSDLQFNTFFDVIFYLIAGLCIIKEKFNWIIPISFLAALNRETGILIPFLLLSVSMFACPKGSWHKLMPVFVTSLLIFAVIFAGLRFNYGDQELIIPYGHHWGGDLLSYNLFRPVTWQKVIATMSIIPFLAIIGYPKWPVKLRSFFWTIVPLWVVIHAFSAVMAETRLFLVPQAMVFIPGALFGLARHAPAPGGAAAPLQGSG